MGTCSRGSFPEAHQSMLVGKGHRGKAATSIVRAPTLVGAPYCLVRRGQHRGRRGYRRWWVFALGITHQWCSALWWLRLPPQAFLFAELSSLPSLRMSPQSQLQSSAWVCSPNPTFQHPRPCLQQGTPSQAGGHGRGQYPCTGLTLSCCHTLAARSLHRMWSPPFSFCCPQGHRSHLPSFPPPFHSNFLLTYLAQQESFLSFYVSQVLC